MALETRFADAYLDIRGLQRLAVEGDDLCFFRAVAQALGKSQPEEVARPLLERLASDDAAKVWGDIGLRAKTQAAAALQDIAGLARRWDSAMLDLMPFYVYAVFGRPVHIYQVNVRDIVVLYLPEQEKAHADPIRLCLTGRSIGQNHYDIVVEM